jgi:16S rRNA (cytosine1407-C5)-methyltransferase
MKRRKVRTPVGNLQEEALARYRPLLSEAEYGLLIDELKRPLYPAIRLNPLKVDPAVTIEQLADGYGWKVRPVPYCPTGWWITEASGSISRTLEHHLGDYYIQDAASMLPVELFDLDGLEAPLILDMAASPGGKTTQLASRTGDGGLIIANDSSQSRLTALRLVLQNWGAINYAVTHFPGEQLGAWFPERFDRVLLDAPCSMENLRSTESHPMRPISERERDNLAGRQLRLLKSAFRAVKTGGQVVYSTCTLSPVEDEAVLDGLLRLYPNAVRIENLETRLPRPAPALSSADGFEYHPDVTRAARLWPERFGTSGFFAALITKTSDVDVERQPAPERPLERTDLARLTKAEIASLAGYFSSRFGFDLLEVLSKQDDSLWRREQVIFAIPEHFMRQFASLPFQALGLPVGEYSPDGFVLSHEWVARFGRRFTGGKLVIPSGQVPAWLRGEDIQSIWPGEVLKGQVFVVTDEESRLLGRGKLLAGKLKNLLPRRMVL